MTSNYKQGPFQRVNVSHIITTINDNQSDKPQYYDKVVVFSDLAVSFNGVLSSSM